MRNTTETGSMEASTDKQLWYTFFFKIVLMMLKLELSLIILQITLPIKFYIQSEKGMYQKVEKILD